MRMRGYDVLHPMGWDAFGLPTENAAIETGRHPADLTREWSANYKRQLDLAGGSYDWAREINSTQPEYYRWTQWMFLKLYERGLAYRASGLQWWCPICGALANEEVNADGTDWRDHTDITQRQLTQWFFKITDYADQLIEDLNGLDWPDETRGAQVNWIGRSEGADVTFTTEAGDELPVFTTRPDTLFGATFMVLAPEHPLVSRITTPDRADEVQAYVAAASRKAELERVALDDDKTGVFTGGYAVNPVNNERLPIWIADYVLMSYGSGAIMAVPAHDLRDFDFATRYGIEIRTVIAPPDWDGQPLTQAFVDDGPMVNSGQFDGLSVKEGVRAVTEWLLEQGKGDGAVNYKLRDWLISRQRYWGTPIPIVALPRLRRGSRAGGPAARSAALRGADRPAETGWTFAPGSRRGLGQHRLPRLRRSGPARNRHPGRLRLFQLVLPALLQPGPAGPRLRSRHDPALDAGGPLRRRRRAQRHAPALRPLLGPRPCATPACWT